MKKTVLLFLLSFSLFAHAQESNCQAIEVLTLGVFHFNFPNLDVQKTQESDQIDVLDEKYQDEIEKIVEKIALFKPTIIVIEKSPKSQTKIDSLYKLYLADQYNLARKEEEQIGFRLARKMGLSKLYCVDEWGDFDSKMEKIISGSDTLELNKFVSYMQSNPDSDKKIQRESIFKTKGILEELIQLNNPENIKNSLGDYLVGAFKYESEEGDFLGVKFETGRWFSRNLKIFRNIQRIEVAPSDKILVIYGSGHLNILNTIFDASPEYKLVKTNDYLQ